MVDMVNEEMINRVLANCAGEEESDAVAAYFATEEGQKHLAGLIDGSLESLETGAEPLARNIPSEEIYRSVIKAIHRRRLRRVALQACAAVIPLFVAAGLLMLADRNLAGGHLFDANETAQVVVPNGDKMKVVFHDGSSVYLNAGSVLSYPVKFGLRSRDVTLEGEGYFEVSKNPSRPFRVHFKDGEVAVYGTSFNLSAYGGDKIVSLSLDSGNVVMNVGGESYEIVPGQVLYYDRTAGTSRLENGGNLFKSRWKDGVISFKSAPLQEIVTSLSRTFAVDFTVDKDVDTTVLYTFTSSVKSLDSLLDELAIIAPVSISRNEETILISAR